MWARRSAKRTPLPLWLSAGFVVAGMGAVGAALTWSDRPAQAATPVPVHVAGRTVPQDADRLQAARQLARTLLTTPFTLRFGQHAVEASLSAMGARIDVTHLARLLEEASDERSALRRLHDHHHPGAPVALPLPVTLDDEAAMAHAKELKDRVDRAPRDARVDPRARSVLPSEEGRELDLIGTLIAMEGAMREGRSEVSAVVRARSPKRTAQAFADVDMSAELSRFETPYNRADTASDRTHNLTVAAQKIDGLVVGPGETFDFNEVVGDRTRANGFRNATVISDGKLVDGMGGGTCQVASTLHAAVLFAGLPVLTRNPHSRPSYYIKLGLDAVVAYDALNFRFKNDRDTPIVIDATVKDGVAKVALRGTEQDRAVTFIREIKKALPFAEETVEDEELPRGLRVLQQRGVPGFEVHRTRIIRDAEGHELSKEHSADLYPPTEQIWRIGKGPEAGPDFVPPENDGHPEYVADEFLTAVRPVDSSELTVTAKPGRFGTYGWTKRELELPASR